VNNARVTEAPVSAQAVSRATNSWYCSVPEATKSGLSKARSAFCSAICSMESLL